MDGSGTDVRTQLPFRMSKELFQPCLLLSLDPRYSLVGVLGSQRTRADILDLDPTCQEAPPLWSGGKGRKTRI